MSASAAKNGETARTLCKIQEFIDEFFDGFVVKSITENTNLFEPSIHLTQDETRHFLLMSFTKYMEMENLEFQLLSEERWCEIKRNLRFDSDFNNKYNEVEYIFSITEKYYHRRR